MKRITMALFLMLLPGLLFGCRSTTPGSDSLLSDLTRSDSDSTTAEQSSLTSASGESELSSVGVQMPSYTEIRNEDEWCQYDENSRLILYILDVPTESPSEDWLTEAQLRDKAEEYLKTQVPLEQYTYVKTNDYPDRYEKSFYYERIINGYSSFDSILITVTYDGTISSFSAPRVGIFDNVTIPKIDEARLLEQLDVMVKKQFGDVTYTEFTNDRTLAIMEDGSLAMHMRALPDGMDEIYTWEFYVPIE